MNVSDSFKADYQSLVSGTGFVELLGWTTIALAGEDRQAFLHNMCTNDIRQLSAGDSCEAFLTDVKGKIVAQILVIAQADRLLLFTLPDQANTLLSHLDKYIIREDVQLKDLSRSSHWFYLSGENVADIPTDSECFTTRCNMLWPGGMLVCCPRERRKTLVVDLQSAELRRCSQEAIEALRIESKLPLYENDFTSTNLPQEVDRDKLSISFNKGCYLGQETIARIDALGHVNQKIVLLSFAGDTIPPVGIELFTEDKNVGQVTSMCWSPKFQKPLALATVRRGSNELDCQLESSLGVATVIPPAGYTP